MKKLGEKITKKHQSINLGHFVSLVLELVLEKRIVPRGERKQESKGRIKTSKESNDQARNIWIKQL